VHLGAAGSYPKQRLSRRPGSWKRWLWGCVTQNNLNSYNWYHVFSQICSFLSIRFKYSIYTIF
jgi:hypothetical protein